ncbi:MAG: hypothetical protein NVSMB52_13840 [Chloroflexota bacterium]
MDTPHGIKGTIQGMPYTDLHEKIVREGVSIEVTGADIEVGFAGENERDRAERVARAYIDAYAFSHNVRLPVNFNGSRESRKSGGRTHEIQIAAEALLSRGRIQVVVNRGNTASEEYFDSASFTNVAALADKALDDAVLREALHYFNAETLDNDRPLYGVYKALEVIYKSMPGGKPALGKLVGKDKRYVDDVTESTQVQRHSRMEHSRRLTDDHCKQRARELIQAYADSR